MENIKADKSNIGQNIFERLLEKRKWEHRAKPLENRLRYYKDRKRERESILYRYDYDMYVNGYGRDDTYRCSIVLRRSIDEYNYGRLLWSCIDRISDKPNSIINLNTYWQYNFSQKFIEKALTIPTAENSKTWYLDVGHGHGLPISTMRKIVRDMRDYCYQNDIIIPVGTF